MNLGNLKYAAGSRKNRKKVGRGGAHGKQSTRGHKGQHSRSGANFRAWFEGGQMPIQRRLPKRGFTNLNRVEYQVVNVSRLEQLQGIEEITPQVLIENGVVSKKNVPIKILGNGDLSKKLSVSANAFTQSAIRKIEEAGGRITKI
jgi:large subunit ribosomal protein L15